MDGERFLDACRKEVGREYERNSVGLLSEKTLHAVLKSYFESDRTYHEVKLGAFYADIFRDGEVTEIQTRSLSSLRGKLDAFLPSYPVRVVYPIPYEKRLIWLDKESGEAQPPKRVGRRGSFYDAGREIWYLSNYLLHPNLTIHLLLIDMDEYRLMGKGQSKHYGAVRYNRIPKALRDELILHDAADYAALFPDALSLPFTAKDFRRAVKGGPRTAPALLSVLFRLGIVRRVGKDGNAYLYEKV